MNLTATRLKKSTKPYTYKGQTVYVFHQRDDDKLVITTDINFIDGFTFPNVDLSELEPVFKMRAGISSTPKILTMADKAFKSDLNVFYASQLLVCPDACEECSTPLYGYSKDELRGLIAHILPKSKNSGFPVVAIHPKNRLFLGTKCGCHSAWDNMGAKERSEMNVYLKAIERFSEFADLLTERDLIRAYKYLNID